MSNKKSQLVMKLGHLQDKSLKTITVSGREEKSLEFEVNIPDKIKAEYGVIAVNVKEGSNYFPDIAKTIVYLQT